LTGQGALQQATRMAAMRTQWAGPAH
jgi:hypothetical protein